MSADQSIKEFLLKAERFCAYRERCSLEIKEKLRSLGASHAQIEEIIEVLKKEDFLDDKRFARLFTSGKFRIKKWGKKKIQAELRWKKISDSDIRDALQSINMTEYRKTIGHLIDKKKRQLGSGISAENNQKIIRFLASKGFETSEIIQALRKA